MSRAFRARVLCYYKKKWAGEKKGRAAVVTNGGPAVRPLTSTVKKNSLGSVCGW